MINATNFHGIFAQLLARRLSSEIVAKAFIYLAVVVFARVHCRMAIRS